MPSSLSAKKRDRQNAKRRGRNRWRKDQVKEVVKTFEKLVHDGKKDEATTQLSQVFKKLDRVSAKGTIHKNAANRKKARMAKRLHKMATAAQA